MTEEANSTEPGNDYVDDIDLARRMADVECRGRRSAEMFHRTADMVRKKSDDWTLMGRHRDEVAQEYETKAENRLAATRAMIDQIQAGNPRYFEYFNSTAQPSPDAREEQ